MFLKCNTFVFILSDFKSEYLSKKNIIQLLPALKVNIIIVHLRGVVFPDGFSQRENNIARVNNYDVNCKCRQ
jgi:hypothetical protein